MEDLKNAVADLEKTISAHGFYGFQDGAFLTELKNKIAKINEELKKLED